MRRAALLLALAIVPGAVQTACSASNGDPIGGDVLDAAAFDAPSGGGGDRDANPDDAGGGTDSRVEDATKTDAPKDSPSDAPPDAPSNTAIRINEVLFTSGANNEYVELRGAPGTPLDTLAIRFVDKTGATTGPFTVAGTGETMPVDGRWVVGGALVSNVDQIHLITGANGWDVPNDRGAVQLYVTGTTTAIDVLGYSDLADAAAVPAPATDPKTTFEGKPATSPGTVGPSLGRKSGAADTNANDADFCAMTASPGADNGTTCQ